jgi:hypothetical protein
MNKKTLSLAIAAAVGAAPSALAEVNLIPATGTTGTLAFANENTIGALGATIEAASDNLDVRSSIGFSITDGTERYIRYDIDGAALAGTMADSDLLVESALINASVSISAGGQAKDNYVIFEVTAANAASVVGPSNNAVVSLPNLSITGKNDVTVTYGLYSTPEAAVSAGTTLASDSGKLATFTNAGNHAAVAVTTEAIDVAQGTAYFATATKDVTSVIGAFVNAGNTVTAVVSNLPDATTDLSASLDTVAGVTSLEVSGDFSFGQDLGTDGEPDGTYTAAGGPLAIHNTAACNNVVLANAVSMTATKAVFNLTGAADTGDTTYYICATANGKSLIPPQTFTGSLATSGVTGVYDAESAALTFGTLVKNGTSVALNLALKPGGAFSNFIRVNNTSGIAGDVSMIVYNDAGDSVSIMFGDVAGVDSSVLPAYGSSDLVAIGDIYDAAVAADATFDVGDGKLRVIIDGEFTGIDAQSITLSTDNTSFTTF